MNTQSDARSRDHSNRLLFTCVGVHLLIDFALMGQAWFPEDFQLLFGVGLPLGQCSLATIWSVSCRGNLALRFIVPAVVAVFSWYVLSRMLMWGVGEPAAVAWGLAVAVQVLSIVVAYYLYQVVRYLISRSDDDARAALTFNLRSLMLWSTVVACGFGFVQYGRQQWRWDVTVADWEYLDAMPLIGVFNAQVALLCWWSLAGGSWMWRCTKIIVTVSLIGSSAYLLPRALDWTTSGHGLTVTDTLMLSAAQATIITATLAAVLYANSTRTSNAQSISTM